MGTKIEAFAKQFEEKVQEAITTIEKFSDTDWKKITEVEKWPVGVTAHHFAGSLGPISDAIKALVAGRSLGFSMDMLDEMNARHAKEYANCTKKETIDLLKENAAAAAGVLRGLRDDQLAKSGVVAAGAPPMTVEQFITGGLIGHINGHLASIRKAVGDRLRG